MGYALGTTLQESKGKIRYRKKLKFKAGVKEAQTNSWGTVKMGRSFRDVSNISKGLRALVL